MRRIEVKARRGQFPVVMTNKEYEEARRQGNDYYLYVTDDSTGYEIQDPVRNCSIDKKMIQVWIVQNWEAKGKIFDIHAPTVPS